MKPKRIPLEKRIFQILEHNIALPSDTENELLRIIKFKEARTHESWANEEHFLSNLKQEVKESLKEFYRLQTMIDEGDGEFLMKQVLELQYEE